MTPQEFCNQNGFYLQECESDNLRFTIDVLDKKALLYKKGILIGKQKFPQSRKEYHLNKVYQNLMFQIIENVYQ